MDVQMKVIQCANCHMPFAVPSRFDEDRRSDHKEFFCPKGHSQYFPGKSDEEKLKEKLDLKDKQLAEKLRLLEESREEARQLRTQRLEMIEKFLNEHFKRGTKPVLLKDVAAQFKMKTRELHELIQIYFAGFKCVRTGKGYEIVKIEKEKK